MTDLRIVEDVFVRTLQPHASTFQHNPVVGNAQPRARVLLDQQDGSAAALHRFNRLDHLFERFGVQPHRWLVQHDQTRVEHQTARKFDEPLLSAR